MFEMTQIDHYRSTCAQIIGINKKKKKTPEEGLERLSFQEIQNITRDMFRNKKAHNHNPGVLTNIKGKMYCLKLGAVGNQKEFSHYFYTSQYRRFHKS